jgi:2-polyprenyl-3-methyl-5-hydroxy-6-metoxy-1,4-benzoquinol methylase
MSEETLARRAHWQRVYQSRLPDEVSWYRPRLDASLELLELAGLSAESRLIDVGGGASTLVDDLLARGLENITVLDVSAEALAVSRRRLAAKAVHVAWLSSDVLEVELPAGAFDVWHDRAVSHFLTDAFDLARYAQQAAAAVRHAGHAVIGGFAPDGPERCSGLPVARRSAQEMAAMLGPAFELVDERRELHLTPGGAVQSFAYALLRRR